MTLKQVSEDKSEKRINIKVLTNNISYQARDLETSACNTIKSANLLTGKQSEVNPEKLQLVNNQLHTTCLPYS